MIKPKELSKTAKLILLFLCIMITRKMIVNYSPPFYVSDLSTPNEIKLMELNSDNDWHLISEPSYIKIIDSPTLLNNFYEEIKKSKFKKLTKSHTYIYPMYLYKQKYKDYTLFIFFNSRGTMLIYTDMIKGHCYKGEINKDIVKSIIKKGM